LQPLSLDVDEIRRWIAEAGAIARHYFGHVKPEWKGVADPVTAVDREIEQLLTRCIRGAYPDHGLVGEEYGSTMADRDYLWTIDPIDGTRAYIGGLPSWCITIALLYRRVPVFGLVHFPLYDDWTYTDGDDVICNGAVITDRLAKRWQIDSYVMWRSDGASVYDLRFTRTLSMSSAAAHFAYTARGSAVAALTHDAFLWDFAAGAAFMAKQGGEIRFLSGELLDFRAIDLTQRIRGMYVAGHPDVVGRLIPLVTPRDKPVHHPDW